MDRPVFVSIEGVLIYFEEAENLALLQGLCAALPPGSAVVFDSLGAFYHKAQRDNGVMRGVQSRFRWELESPADRAWPWPLQTTSIADEAARHPAIPRMIRWLFWIGTKTMPVCSWRVNLLSNGGEITAR